MRILKQFVLLAADVCPQQLYKGQNRLPGRLAAQPIHGRFHLAVLGDELRRQRVVRKQWEQKLFFQSEVIHQFDFEPVHDFRCLSRDVGIARIRIE